MLQCAGCAPGTASSRTFKLSIAEHKSIRPAFRELFVGQPRMSHVPDFSASNWVLQELVPGSVELSVSMLVSRGTILEVLGMKYLYVAWVH